MTHEFTDDDLMMELAAALRGVRPLTASVAARGKGAFPWRTIDDDLLLAELSFDSAALDAEAELAGSVRSAAARAQDVPEGRVLVFTAPLQSVEVEVLSDCVVGQFLPPAAGTVTIESDVAGVAVRAEVDEGGFFVVEPVPCGLVRFRCETSDSKIVGPWVRL